MSTNSNLSTAFPIAAVLAAAIFFAAASPASAAPIFFAGNGHYYDAVGYDEPQSTPWETGRALAEASVFMGVHGYLATITSQAEQDFLNANFPGRYVYALGAMQDPAGPEAGGGWYWLTGEPFVYTNWGPNEPNDAGNDNENALVTANFDRPPYGTWNDLTASAFATGGYFVEYEGPFDAVEPGTLGLLLTPLLAIGFLQLRRRK